MFYFFQMIKPLYFIAYAKRKAQISFAVTAKLIIAYVFATRIVQSLFFLNPNFEAPCYFLLLYRRVCVRPCQKPGRQFSHVSAHFKDFRLCYHSGSTLHPSINTSLEYRMVAQSVASPITFEADAILTTIFDGQSFGE